MFGLDLYDEYNASERLSEERENTSLLSKALTGARKQLEQANEQLAEARAQLEKSQANKLVLNYFHADFGVIFWDQNNTIIKAIHENDADFRDEYYESLFMHYDIELVHHEKRPNFITLKELRYLGIAE